MKKYSLNYVKKSFALDNYKLTSNDKYINGRQKFDYICSKGHRHSISFGKWLEGRRCPYCDGQGKPTIEFIRSQFENINYILLTDVYVNSCNKLEYICSNGHQRKISWNDWRSGRRCIHCLVLDKIESSFENENYIILSIDNFSWRARVLYKCSLGHEHAVSWSNWSRGTRCPTCAYIKKSGPGHPNWKNGISCELYCDAWADKEYKEDIKARDNYECQNPYCWGTGTRLVLHHVDYIKKNCIPVNLITLCNSCNSGANFRREFHEEFYKNIMKNIVGSRIK